MNKAKGNPYKKGTGSAKTQKSIVAFIDLLGFQNAIMTAQNVDKLDMLLRDVKAAINDSKTAIANYRRYNMSIRHEWFTKLFSDCIVIGYPLGMCFREQGGDVEGWGLFEFFRAIQEFQLSMTNHGWFTRGAISIGQHYMDNDVIFGDAVVEAYHAESTKAIFPRIMLCPSTYSIILELINADDFYISPYLKDTIYVDQHDVLYINYLGITVCDDPWYTNKNALSAHKAQIELNLFQHSDSRVRQKYEWSANYHNSYCSQFVETAEFVINDVCQDIDIGKSLWNSGWLISSCGEV